MLARVTRISALGCSAVTDNEVGFVFSLPPGIELAVNDLLEIELSDTGDSRLIADLTRGRKLGIVVKHDDIHDLRLPASHSGSRFPSQARLRGAGT